jgi:hypothetical protein
MVKPNENQPVDEAILWSVNIMSIELSCENNRTNALGFNRPYGSSSLGLNTLHSVSQEAGYCLTEDERYYLDLALLFDTSEVWTRGSFGNHFRMDASQDGLFDALN